MENEAERQIDYGADDDGDDVVLGATKRNWRRAGIFAALKRDAIVHRPGQYRSEQDDAAEIAVGAEMGEGPGFHRDKQRMLEHAFDISGNIGRRDHDAGRPHQSHDDVPRPSRRIPDHDHAGRAIGGKAVGNQNDSEDRNKREQGAVRPLADLGHDCSASVAHGHKYMRAEKNDKAENFESKTHYAAPLYVEFPDGCARYLALAPGGDHGRPPSIVNERTKAYEPYVLPRAR